MVTAVQLARIYLDMLNVYKCLSENISNAVAVGGECVSAMMEPLQSALSCH